MHAYPRRYTHVWIWHLHSKCDGAAWCRDEKTEPPGALTVHRVQDSSVKGWSTHTHLWTLIVSLHFLHSWISHWNDVSFSCFPSSLFIKHSPFSHFALAHTSLACITHVMPVHIKTESLFERDWTSSNSSKTQSLFQMRNTYGTPFIPSFYCQPCHSVERTGILGKHHPSILHPNKKNWVRNAVFRWVKATK